MKANQRIDLTQNVKRNANYRTVDVNKCQERYLAVCNCCGKCMQLSYRARSHVHRYVIS